MWFEINFHICDTFLTVFRQAKFESLRLRKFEISSYVWNGKVKEHGLLENYFFGIFHEINSSPRF